MKIRELIDVLEQFADIYGDYINVYISMYQKYGQDFAKEVEDIEVRRINTFFGADIPEAICIVESDQIGVHDDVD